MAVLYANLFPDEEVACHIIFLRHMGRGHPLMERGAEPWVDQYETPLKHQLSIQSQPPLKSLCRKYDQ